jgi:hypothetical protein
MDACLKNNVALPGKQELDGENKQQPTESGETGLLDAKKEEADADNEFKD